MARLFGTDGVRGIANEELTAELAYNIGRASAYILSEGKKGSMIVGRDTRISGNMLEAAIVAGVTSTGIDIIEVGVLPTPSIAYLVRELNALGGFVISASHNPGEYNGIKLFDNKGLKLPDEKEEEIEKYILDIDKVESRPIGKDIGKSIIYNKGKEDYKSYLKEIINIDLTGYKIALDCGNGALYKVAPELFEELNATVYLINDNPDGMNINDNCGSTNPDLVSKLVLEKNADIGISFDGDGDRIIAVDEKGKIINGDHILAVCSNHLKERGKLKNNTVVGTIMTNMGLDEYLESKDMNIVKTQVGDRYILEEMLEKDYSLGGEQSGHIIFLDYNTTGDGLLTGLYLLKVMIDENKTLSALSSSMKDFPQVLINAKVNNSMKYNYLDNDVIRDEIERIEKLFHGKGRVVIRPSGTEPLVRVMIEGEDITLIEKVAKDLAKLIEDNIG
ncbi:MAG TPA: phosphoglucosamine mutase [Tissierellaceae bacterium]